MHVSSFDFSHRALEEHSIAGQDEAKRYIAGTSYPENSDYILFAKELNNSFDLKGKRVLEFCSGPGGLAYELCKYNPAEVLAVDASDSMVAYANVMYFNNSLCFIQRDCLNLNGISDFDLVVCQNSTHHFTENELTAFLKSGVNCLKMGGIMYISDYRRENIDNSILEKRLKIQIIMS